MCKINTNVYYLLYRIRESDDHKIILRFSRLVELLIDLLLFNLTYLQQDQLCLYTIYPRKRYHWKRPSVNIFKFPQLDGTRGQERNIVYFYSLVYICTCNPLSRFTNPFFRLTTCNFVSSDYNDLLT